MMTNKEIVDTLRVISKLFASDEVSVALNVAACTLESQETILKEEYQRGLNDAWNAAKDIELSIIDGGLSREEIERTFGYRMSPDDVLKEFNPEEVVSRLKNMMRKKCDE